MTMASTEVELADLVKLAGVVAVVTGDYGDSDKFGHADYGAALEVTGG